MKMALGFNEQKAEAFLSPSKRNGEDEEEEEIYEDVEYLIEDAAE